MPKPKKDENRDDFIGRCVTDSKMEEEFPDKDQRLAVCFDIWDKATPK